MQPLDSLKENNDLLSLLVESESIAVVGLSPKEDRPSNMVGRYLIGTGYKVYPVNPGQKEILGQACYADLASIPEKIDIINIFRKSQDVLAVVEDVVRLPHLPRAVWMQQGIVNNEAAELARRNGIMVIMDRCIKIDHQHLVKQ